MSPRDGAKTAQAIRQAAIRLFYSHGFEATTQRDLATEVGIKVGSIYNHIDSKQELLFSIMFAINRDLLEEARTTVAQYASPREQLQAIIELHVSFHVSRAKEVFIGNSELRSLPPVKRAAIVEQRDAYAELIREIVAAGAASGDFHVVDATLVTFGIVAIGTSVSTWYRTDGRLDVDDIASIYSDFILRSLTNPERQVDLGDVLGNAIAVES